jgi:xanthine dehydrogenase accessory factor
VNSAEAMRRLLLAEERGEVVLEVLVVESTVATVAAGRRLLVYADRVEGTLGDRAIAERVCEIARPYLHTEGRSSERLELTEGTLDLYLSLHRPPDDLVILGAGHIARPLCAIGSMLGYRVTVLDDRPSFATRERFPEADRVLEVSTSDPFADVTLSGRTRLVLATRGHRFDFEALRLVMASETHPGYIGMVGSRRRVRATLEQLVREGVPAEQLGAIHAPIGLDIGAETPEEIAVAIAAELVRLRRGGSGESLRERERVMERWVRPPA